MSWPFEDPIDRSRSVRRERAESHFCQEVRAQIYCSSIDCPYCSEQEQEETVRTADRDPSPIEEAVDR